MHDLKKYIILYILINSALKAKLAEDIAKFNAYQANRWKSVHEKLDSVYVRIDKLFIINIFVVNILI